MDDNRQEQDFTAEVELKDGTRALVRPARPEDKPGLEDMLRSCSPETIYTRFLSPGLSVPLRYLDRLMLNEPPRVVSLVAEMLEEEDKGKIAALMNFVRTGPGNRGELAIIVADRFQNRGLGSAMLRHLYGLAKKAEIKKFIADIDAGNRRVFHLIRKSGLPCNMEIDQGVAHVEVEIK